MLKFAGKQNGLKRVKKVRPFRLESARQSNNTIKSVISHGGKTLKADKEILDHVGQFYSKLYASDINKIQRFMNHIENPKILTLQQQRECEGKIKIEECSQVVRKLALNKSPWAHSSILSDILVRY